MNHIRILEELHDDHDHHDEEESGVGMARAIVIILLVITATFMFLPYRGSNHKNLSKCQQNMYSWASCFAAGMLLAIAAVHILPEANAMWAAAMEEENHEDETAEEHAEHGDEHDEHEEEGGHGFPLPFVLMIVGFNAMLFMDQVLFKQNKHEHSEAVKTPVTKTVAVNGMEAEGGNGETIDVQPQADKVYPDEEAVANGEKPAEDAKLDINTKALITFGIALCLHSLVDGLAIGVFEHADEMVVLAASVIIHKVPVSCTLGFTFAQSGLPLKSAATIIVFTLYMISAPLGLIIGAVISEHSLDTTLVII